MAEQSGFFDAYLVDGEYDRVYLAESFAKYFASFIGNGVFGGKSDELMVRQKEIAGMSVRVLTGMGFINGYFYENTDEVLLPIDTADGVLNRIDSIVLRWSKADRAIRVAVEKGFAATTPVAPTPKRNEDYYDLVLANVYVKAGATSITQSVITDMRLDTDVCGLVVAVVKQFDTTEFKSQIASFLEDLDVLINTNDFVSFVNRLGAIEEVISGAAVGAVHESEQYPGCFYRLVDGVEEWLNPPTEAGVEYKLAERLEGNPVYQMLIYVPSLPSSSNAVVASNVAFKKIVSIEAIMYRDTGTSYTSYPFPVYMDNAVAPVAVVRGFTTGLLGRGVVFTTTQDLTTYKANVLVKYTKP